MNQLIYTGKSKNVYKRGDGNLEFYFKDAATGMIREDGTVVFDPGYDTVAGEIPGKGKVSCAFTTHFFKLLKNQNVSSHYVENLDDRRIVVQEAELLKIPGLYNLEWVYRNNVHGSFLRRYPFVPFCKALHGLVEVYTKGDTDTLIVDDALVEIGVMTRKDLEDGKRLVKKVNSIISSEFKRLDLHLIDGKVELGRVGGRIMLIDDISPDVMRVCRGCKLDEQGNCSVDCGGKNVISPMELYKEVFG